MALGEKWVFPALSENSFALFHLLCCFVDIRVEPSLLVFLLWGSRGFLLTLGQRRQRLLRGFRFRWFPKGLMWTGRFSYCLRETGRKSRDKKNHLPIKIISKYFFIPLSNLVSRQSSCFWISGWLNCLKKCNSLIMIKWGLSVIIRKVWFFLWYYYYKKNVVCAANVYPWSLSWVIQKAALALCCCTLGTLSWALRRATEQLLNSWCQQHPHSSHFWRAELLTEFVYGQIWDECEMMR